MTRCAYLPTPQKNFVSLVNLASKDSVVPLQFATERLHVRRFTPQDESALFEAARESIDKVYPFLPWCHPDYSIQDARRWIEAIEPAWIRGEQYSFLIKEKGSGKALGGIGLNQIDEHPVANLGYWIRSTETGKGFATEATRGMIHYGFNHVHLQRIEIVMSTLNVASRQVAINVGAKLEGTARNRLHLHGENHDAYVYAVVPEDL